MNLQTYHEIEHTSRGFGESPATCQVCAHEHPELVARIAALESRNGNKDSLALRIGVAAAASVLAAYVIEKFIRKSNSGSASRIVA